MMTPLKARFSQHLHENVLDFGIAVSTLFTLFIVPMVYYMAYRKKFALSERGERDGQG
jgi:multidrug efflux pump subunit AcrB